MGYRWHIQRVDKGELDKLKSAKSGFELATMIPNSEMEEGYLHISSDIGETMYCLGKPYYSTFLSKLGDELVPVFTKEFNKEYFPDNEILHLTKDQFKKIIEEGYIKEYAEYIKEEIFKGDFKVKEDEIQPDQETVEIEVSLLAALVNYVRSDYRSMAHGLIKLDGDGSITSSWDKKFAAFELARLYRSIDWETEETIIIGW